jgi:acetyl esterase/lipase
VGSDRGPLHGVPIAIKDLIDMAGLPTTFASRAGSPRLAETDAVLVRNLKQAGAIVLGKTNLLEYAYGAVHPDFGQTNNPWDPRRTSEVPAAARQRRWPLVSVSLPSARIPADRSGFPLPIAAWQG